jgi:hypothetical protein
MREVHITSYSRRIKTSRLSRPNLHKEWRDAQEDATYSLLLLAKT